MRKKNPQTKDSASYLPNANVFYCWGKKYFLIVIFLILVLFLLILQPKRESNVKVLSLGSLRRNLEKDRNQIISVSV